MFDGPCRTKMAVAHGSEKHKILIGSRDTLSSFDSSLIDSCGKVYCVQYLETKFNKETYRIVTISTFIVYSLLLNAWTISRQYLTIQFSSFSGEDF